MLRRLILSLTLVQTQITTFSVSVMELYGTLWNFTFGGKVPELYGTF